MPIIEASNIETFAAELGVRGLTFSEEEFTLHSGSQSHWIVDCKRGLANGRMLGQMAGYMVQAAENAGIDYDLIAGQGLGGELVVYAMAVAATKIGREVTIFSYVEDELEEPHRREALINRRKLNKDKKALVVDDVATSGGSLLEMIDMQRQDGANVLGACSIVDRSKHTVALALRNMGLSYFSLLEFEEESATLRPAQL